MKRINVSFDDKEIGMLDALHQMYGGSLPDVIRAAVQFRYDKAFPAHTRTMKRSAVVYSKPEEELTDEQFCELWGGKVERSAAGNVCTQQYRGATYSNLVTNRDNIQANGKMIQGLKASRKQ